MTIESTPEDLTIEAQAILEEGRSWNATAQASVNAAIDSISGDRRYTYYVDSINGDDNSTDASSAEGTPFLTIEAAIAATPQSAMLTANLKNNYVIDSNIDIGERLIKVSGGGNYSLSFSSYEYSGKMALKGFAYNDRFHSQNIIIEGCEIILPSNPNNTAVHATRSGIIGGFSKPPTNIGLKLYECNINQPTDGFAVAISSANTLLDLSVVNTTSTSIMDGLWVRGGGVQAGDLSSSHAHIRTNLDTL